MTVEIKDKLYKDISNYCKVNHLVIKEYVNQLLMKQFMVDKYGDKPGVYIVPDKPVKDNAEFPPVITKENDHLEFDKPVEVEIEVNKNKGLNEYEVVMKETTIPIETSLDGITKNSVESEKPNDQINELIDKKPKKRKLK